MQSSTEEYMQLKRLKNSVVSIPTTAYADKMLDNNLEIDSLYNRCNNENAFADLWQKQHPLIHVWLFLSSISICFLFALFFIFQ